MRVKTSRNKFGEELSEWLSKVIQIVLFLEIDGRSFSDSHGLGVKNCINQRMNRLTHQFDSLGAPPD